jgi:hypothetical protein
MTAEMYRLLLQIALLGAEVRDFDSATQIAEAVRNAHPDLPHSRAVLAMIRLAAGQKDEAVRELETALELFPDFQLGKALLGVSMKAGGRSGWQSLLEDVIEDGRDEFAVGMASEILGRPRNVAGDSIGSAPQPPDSAPGHIVWA